MQALSTNRNLTEKRYGCELLHIMMIFFFLSNSTLPFQKMKYQQFFFIKNEFSHISLVLNFLTFRRLAFLGALVAMGGTRSLNLSLNLFCSLIPCPPQLCKDNSDVGQFCQPLNCLKDWPKAFLQLFLCNRKKKRKSHPISCGLCHGEHQVL